MSKPTSPEVRRFIAGRLAASADEIQREIASLLPGPGAHSADLVFERLMLAIGNLDRRLARVTVAIRCLADDDYDPRDDATLDRPMLTLVKGGRDEHDEP